jgi:hypothetical protein
MILFKNTKWLEAEKYFTGPKVIPVKNMEILVDYEYKSECGELLAFGFDLPPDFIDTDDIFHYVSQKDNEENSIWKKIMNFYNIGHSPIPFLVSNNFIYYMPSGTRQINIFSWAKEDNLDNLISKLKNIDNEMLQEQKMRFIYNEENQNSITLDELKSLTTNQQLNAILSNPFYKEFENSEYLDEKTEKGRQKRKATSQKLTRLCFNMDNPKSIKIKGEYYHSERIYGDYSESEESTSGPRTFYLLMNEMGNFEEIEKTNEDEIKYRNFKLIKS